jgi:hypothetical protein
MRALILIAAAAISALALNANVTHSEPGPLVVLAEFPGSSLKWVHIAEPVFQQKKLEIDKYTVTVVDEGGDSVTVILTELGLPDTVRGSGKKYPGYEVEISKKDGKVLDSYYSR